MEDEKSLQELIISYERELLALKTGYNVAPNVNVNVAKYSGDSTNKLVIEYEDGVEPIITNVYSEQSAILGPVVGRSQNVFFANSVGDVEVVSTRKILNVGL